jgi:hydroxyacylglutathione hydrolase
MGLRIQVFTVGTFQVNTFLVTDEATGLSALIDTGETDELVRRVSAIEPPPDVRMILLTHSHLDHAGALPLLQARWDVPTCLPRADKPLFDTLPMQGRMFGMPHLDRPCGRIDRWLDDGDTVQLGQTTFGVLSTPGHTPGQACYWTDTDIFVGDTLFAGSVGRTDFPLSSPAAATESLRRLLALPAHLRVHSGHGPVTTLGAELNTNPFLGYLRRERGLPAGPSVRWAPGT